MIKLMAITLGFVLLNTPEASAKPIEVQWWHAMSGELGKKVDGLARQFNDSQKQWRVIPTYKGTYTETLTATIAAVKVGKPPHIVQVFEVGTATMMSAGKVIYPVHQLMKDTGTPFDSSQFIPAVAAYYTTDSGKLLSMPFNSSTPVLYYNKNGFKKAGLDAENPPKTWPEVELAAKALMQAGFKCGFTSTWPSWVQLENFSAIHDIPFASAKNGFADGPVQLLFNSPKHVQHISKLAEWQKSKLFDYGGRRGDAGPKFLSGECPMHMDSSAAYAGIVKGTKGFDFGVGRLPYWPVLQSKPQNSIIGGATLWAMTGHDKTEKQAMAQFLNFISSAPVQAEWHQQTGYLPITHGAYELTKQQAFYKKNPGMEIPLLQMNRETPTANSRGLRLGNFVQIREVINQELENVWSGAKTPKKALDDAVAKGNKLLKRFRRTQG